MAHHFIGALMNQWMFWQFRGDKNLEISCPLWRSQATMLTGWMAGLVAPLHGSIRKMEESGAVSILSPSAPARMGGLMGYLMGDVFAIETWGMYQCDIQLLMLNGNRIWVSQEWTWSLNRRWSPGIWQSRRFWILHKAGSFAWFTGRFCPKSFLWLLMMMMMMMMMIKIITRRHAIWKCWAEQTASTTARSRFLCLWKHSAVLKTRVQIRDIPEWLVILNKKHWKKEHTPPTSCLEC